MVSKGEESDRSALVVRWGVLGAAGIAVKKVIPGMQHCKRAQVVAIASRDRKRADEAASKLGLPKAYDSYEQLLADPDIDVIYNPLPNHLHVPWTVNALAAGKHVLCEKPIALNTEGVRTLLAARDRCRLQVGEAFMIRTHPQWLRTRELVGNGAIGSPRLIQSTFSYFNANPANIRNQAEIGGGGLMDIGCYPITAARFLFGREPVRVLGLFGFDPQFKTDRLTSAVLDFGEGQAIFSCSTQAVPFQRFEILGTTGRIELPVPYNAPPDSPTRLLLDDGTELGGQSAHEEQFPAVDQYALQGDAFSAAVQGERPVPVSLEDAFGNMAALDALFRSAQSGRWEVPEALA